MVRVFIFDLKGFSLNKYLVRTVMYNSSEANNTKNIRTNIDEFLKKKY